MNDSLLNKIEYQQVSRIEDIEQVFGRRAPNETALPIVEAYGDEGRAGYPAQQEIPRHMAMTQHEQGIPYRVSIPQDSCTTACGASCCAGFL